MKATEPRNPELLHPELIELIDCLLQALEARCTSKSAGTDVAASADAPISTDALVEPLSDVDVQKILRAYMRTHGCQASKRFALELVLSAQECAPEMWEGRWNLNVPTRKPLAQALIASLVKKPRRTASGIAAITVLTKPWPCSGQCMYCPNDIRMPKSYLHNEPACARAEENCFDPFLQVSTRLLMLTRMGHPVDKIELIILGGTFNEYPLAYRIWFVAECFRALNMGASFLHYEESKAGRYAQARRAAYERDGYPQTPAAAGAYVMDMQARIDAGELTYNQAFAQLWGSAQSPASRAASWQRASWAELEELQHQNKTAASRMVGLVFETRPDAINPEVLTTMRHLGATKVQMGIQSLNQQILDVTDRRMQVADVARALDLLRLFGFKLHVHFMVNLPGATPAADKADFMELVTNPAYLPDEIKLYPCALIGATPLVEWHQTGRWEAYPQDVLVDVLVSDVLATPRYTRISRMIRDFSTQDVLAGNDHPNLRQAVESQLEAHAADVQEIRFREIATARKLTTPELRETWYTTNTTREVFLEWVVRDIEEASNDVAGALPSGTNKLSQRSYIAGFLRLSLPKPEGVCAFNQAIAINDALLSSGQDLLHLAPTDAMIREVHVYGFLTQLGQQGSSAQHQGLGKMLVEHAEKIARSEGYTKLRVISAVGTRGYYERLGFAEEGLYQSKRI